MAKINVVEADLAFTRKFKITQNGKGKAGKYIRLPVEYMDENGLNPSDTLRFYRVFGHPEMLVLIPQKFEDSDYSPT